MATNNREVTLRAFLIKSTSLSKNINGIFTEIAKKLNDSIVEDRVMVLNQED